MMKKVVPLIILICLLANIIQSGNSCAAGNTTKDIVIGSNQIKGYSNNQYTYVYFGKFHTVNGEENLRWHVLVNNDEGASYKNENGTNYSGDAALLLSDKVIDSGQFNAKKNGDIKKPSNIWSESDIKAKLTDYMNEQSNVFTKVERMTILKTTKVDKNTGNLWPHPISETESLELGACNLEEERLFVLSGSESLNPKYGFSQIALEPSKSRVKNHLGTVSSTSWVLRSPVLNDNSTVGEVNHNGSLYIPYIDYTTGICPAFNLKMDSILFTSAAIGGKVSGEVGLGGLKETKEVENLDLKLTIIDDERSSFVTTESVITCYQGDKIKLNYSGAKLGANEYVSAMIVNQVDDVIYYGNIAKNSESGNVDVKIPDTVLPGEYTIKMFSEQCNGDWKTDYASRFCDIALKVNPVISVAGPTTPTTNTNTTTTTNTNTSTGENYRKQPPTQVLESYNSATVLNPANKQQYLKSKIDNFINNIDAWKNPFDDLQKEDWFYNNIAILYSLGIMDGLSEMRFEPKSNMGRGELMNMLYKLEEVGNDKKGTYANASVWNEKNKIFSGSGNGEMGVGDPVTREQLITVLWKSSNAPIVQKETRLSQYKDENKISGYAKPAFEWAYQQGLIVGNNKSELRPKQNATRAEVATIIVNYINASVQQ